MKAEDRARVESLKNWAPNDPNYQFLIGLIEEQEEIINKALDIIAELTEKILRETES